ncbi:MAG: (2Fe-2S)-binding protein, partial [Armatimonadetes bacterium]|nr:(2Fe-2S)-binding protein [Armatimonadota bacterium]
MTTLRLDGEMVEFREGESLYEVARRHGKELPTLCYEERLAPLGGCRLCVVELEGAARPVPSCTTRAAAGMEVRTSSEALDRHRRTLLEMVASENPSLDVDPLRGRASQQLKTLVGRFGARTGRFAGRLSGNGGAEDQNPFILREGAFCISCYRCVRVCSERQGESILGIVGRGYESRVATAFEGGLKESGCAFCGQCVQTCPTGALADRKALAGAELPETTRFTRTVCGYCGVGCSVDLATRGDRLVAVLPAVDGPVNRGALCVKGQFGFDYVQHAERLTAPLVRENGALREASWDEAL